MATRKKKTRKAAKKAVTRKATAKKSTSRKTATKKTARKAKTARKISRKPRTTAKTTRRRSTASTIPKRLESRRRKSENEGDMLLAERLREARAKRGVTRKVVAEETGIPYESLTGYELCEQRAPFSRIRLLAMHLGISLDYLAGRTQKMAARR